MIRGSTNWKGSVFLLLLILPFSLQFNLQSPTQTSKDLLAAYQNGYRIGMNENKELEVQLLEKGAELKSSTKLTCEPSSIQTSDLATQSTNSQKQFAIKITCLNNKILNFKYNIENNILYQVQKQKIKQIQEKKNIGRLLQNTTIAVCGDGLLNTTATQQCDDGNTVDGDGCSATCKKQSTPVALPLALGVSLGGLAVIGLVIAKFALSNSAAATGTAVAGVAGVTTPQYHAGHRALEIEQSTKVVNASGNLY